jgi:hypothetical protein
MARRRLAPVDPTTVPRAEHLRAPGFPAPIARVTADAVDAASSAELAETLTRARETGRLVLDLPLDTVAADHLTRDRLPDDPEMDALRASIRAHGQRTPIEVTPVSGALPYGLISGWRRLMALKSLHAETDDPRFATVQALVRRPESAADAYITMVEENEIRLGLSHYERARVAALAAARGVFEDEEAALKALFGTASRPKRSRIRSFLELYHALDGALRFPAQLPERLGLALVERVRAGQGPSIAAALADADPRTPEAELRALAALAHPRPDRARPAEIIPGVTLQEDFRGRTLTLRLKGRGVTPELAAAVRAALARLA